MSISLSSNFQLNAQLALDARTVVATIVARDGIPNGQRHDGLTVYVTATSENYQLQGGIMNTDWVLVNPAGGGVSIGDPIVGGTPGSVLFIDSAGDLGENNPEFFWNET